jgi:outer membrane immunogenic protein
MRKSAIAIVAVLVVFCRPSYGGPQPSYSKEAAPPVPVSWTGFYLGVSGGYTRGQVEPELTLGGAFNQLPPLKSGIESRGSEDFDFDGGQAGGVIGYNYQFGNCVIGLEGAGSYLWARDSTESGAFVLASGVPPLDVRTSFKTHYLLTVAPRIGYAFGPILPYLTGGLAVGDLEFSQSIRDLADPASRLTGSTRQDKLGWMIGAGLQYAITGHWSARLQYQYVDLGSAGFDSHVPSTPIFQAHHEVNFTEHNATAALIYKF